MGASRMIRPTSCADAGALAGGAQKKFRRRGGLVGRGRTVSRFYLGRRYGFLGYCCQEKGPGGHGCGGEIGCVL